MMFVLITTLRALIREQIRFVKQRGNFNPQFLEALQGAEKGLSTLVGFY